VCHAAYPFIQMELHFKSYGEGHPLLILHGLLGASGNWHSLSSSRFAPNFKTFAVDLRNHGRSPHSDTFNLDVMAEDVRSFMEGHSLETGHVMGHSMGGKVAMVFALTYPERVDRLIIADMAPREYPRHHEEIFDALRSVNPSAHGSREEVDQALAQRIKAAPVRQFLLKNLVRHGERYAWQMNLEGIYRNYDAINRAVDADHSFDKPTLFIRGEKSDYVTDADFADITRLFPNAQMVTIPGAGHWVHADRPDAFADAVLEFLSR
jgi:esterase